MHQFDGELHDKREEKLFLGIRGPEKFYEVRHLCFEEIHSTLKGHPLFSLLELAKIPVINKVYKRTMV
jgi:hypothetical protein